MLEPLPRLLPAGDQLTGLPTDLLGRLAGAVEGATEPGAVDAGGSVGREVPDPDAAHGIKPGVRRKYLLYLDIKKLGRFARPGHRVTGDCQQNTPGAGWGYVHVAIDDHSRVTFDTL